MYLQSPLKKKANSLNKSFLIKSSIPSNQKLSFTAFINSSLVIAPEILFPTSPSFINNVVGILTISNCSASAPSASTSTLPKCTFPFISFAAAAKWGAIILQGIHHAAQKSTTQLPLLVLEAKFPSVNSVSSLITRKKRTSLINLPYKHRSEERRVGKECRSRW